MKVVITLDGNESEFIRSIERGEQSEDGGTFSFEDSIVESLSNWANKDDSLPLDLHIEWQSPVGS